MKPTQRLDRLLHSGNIPHALLFAGPQRSGKSAAALQFALDLLQTTKKPENHPDIHLYFPEGKQGLYPIESIRKLSQEAALVPYEGKWKIFILHEAEKMLPTSSNALLKTLEEPSSQTLIILISHNPAHLLPTIRSRLQVIEFPPLNTARTNPAILSILAEQRFHDLSHFENEDSEVVFETILLWFRDRLLLDHAGCESYLYFSEHLSSLQKTPLIPFDMIEKKIAFARLAHSRSTKLSTCLEMLFLSLMSS